MRVRLTVEPAELADADLVVLPGSKSTVDDLALAAATPAWPTRCSAHAAAGEPRARHLRRLPDARPSASTTRWRAAGARSTGWVCCPIEITFAAAQDARPVARARRSATCRSRVRDPPRVRLARPTGCRRADPTPTARRGRGARATCSAPTGTARSSPTGSGGRSSPRRPGWPAGTGSRSRRTPASPRARERTARPARRPGRGAPRHRRAVAAHRGRRPRRAAVRPARRPPPADRHRRSVPARRDRPAVVPGPGQRRGRPDRAGLTAERLPGAATRWPRPPAGRQRRMSAGPVGRGQAARRARRPRRRSCRWRWRRPRVCRLAAARLEL